MAKMYYQQDCDLNYLNGKKIAIIGYGSQGHAHALNLKDSGCDVCVGLRAGSKNWAQAEKAGLAVKTVQEAAQWADIVMMLINDEVQAQVYKNDIAPYLSEGNALAFAHGFNIRYQQIVPPAGVDVFMAAPKGPGHTVRSQYVAGKGVPCLVAVEQDATGNAMKIALAYIAGIGGARAGVLETTFNQMAGHGDDDHIHIRDAELLDHLGVGHVGAFTKGEMVRGVDKRLTFVHGEHISTCLCQPGGNGEPVAAQAEYGVGFLCLGFHPINLPFSFMDMGRRGAVRLR